MNQPITHRHSSAWVFQVWATFIISMSLTLGGIYFAPIDLWVKGFFLMGVLFTVGSTFSLAKTVRDQFEDDKLVNRVTSAKAEKLLHDYEYRDVIGATK